MVGSGLGESLPSEPPSPKAQHLMGRSTAALSAFLERTVRARCHCDELAACYLSIPILKQPSKAMRKNPVLGTLLSAFLWPMANDLRD